MMVFVYIALFSIFLNILISGIFFILRNFDRKKIEDLEKEVKSQKAKLIQMEISRMALMRQIEDYNKIKKELKAENARLKNMNLAQTLEKL
jgi:hypothetical protein